MVEVVTVERFQTFDGRRFDTREEADRHEEQNFAALLIGMTSGQVTAALTREPGSIPIADAIEKAGAIIPKVRREAGELRRRPKDKPAEPEGETQREPEREVA